MRRRNVLIAGDLGRAVLLASIPVAAWAHRLSMPQLYVVALLTGVLTVFFDVAYQSYLPHLVGRANLVEGNAKLEIVRAVTQISGPTVSGVLIQALTAPVAIAVDAVSFLGSALFVGRIRKREDKPERAPDANLVREVMEGLRFVFGNRLLRAIAGCTASYNLFGNVMYTMLIVYLARNLNLTPGVIGVVFSVGSVGGLLGAFLANRVVRWLGQGPTIWISTLVGGPTAMLVPLAGRDWRLALAAAGLLLGGAAGVIYNVTQVSFRQTITPERLLGRMNATMRFLVWGTIPVGALASGVLGSAIGVRATLWVGAIGCLVPFFPVFFSPLRNLRTLPDSAEQVEPVPTDEGRLEEGATST
jgi:Na+/melibiose symporter-like transporter